MVMDCLFKNVIYSFSCHNVYRMGQLKNISHLQKANFSKDCDCNKKLASIHHDTLTSHHAMYSTVLHVSALPADGICVDPLVCFREDYDIHGQKVSCMTLK